MDVHARQSCGEAAMPRKASCSRSCWCEHGDQGGRCGCHLRACLDTRASENGIACEQMLRCALMRACDTNCESTRRKWWAIVSRSVLHRAAGASVDERIVAKPACAGESTVSIHGLAESICRWRTVHSRAMHARRSRRSRLDGRKTASQSRTWQSSRWRETAGKKPVPHRPAFAPFLAAGA